MRNRISHPRQNDIRYGIRDIIDLAQSLAAADPDFEFVGENIGDPIAKGWNTPQFVSSILKELVSSGAGNVFGYTQSRGRIETRKWVAEQAKRLAPGVSLSHEDVVFCNGLGAGISSFYRMLAPDTRVLQPAPGYPAHISAERFSAGAESICYRLNPERGWQPDLEQLEHQVKTHPEVGAILLINPNNPTGTVYSAETLKAVIDIAERYGLMLLSDEVYFRLVFNGARYTHISGLARGRVPLVVFQGISKDVPWPGARCGWLEFHNLELDSDYKLFFEGFKKLATVEVCATHLPQAALPLIYDSPEYPGWLATFSAGIQENSNTIADILGRTPGLKASRINGAFYLTALFEEGTLKSGQSLPIANSGSRRIIEAAVAQDALPLDKRFAYFLLASTGICVVPISDFESELSGFRVTTLERDPERLSWCYKTISEAVVNYLGSA